MSETPYPDDFTITMPDAYLIAVGKVNVVWGTMEAVVDLAIHKLAGYELFDPRSAILTAHMTWPQKMDVLESLVTAYRQDYPHLEAFFVKAKPLLKRAQEGRNKIAHGQLSYENGQVYKLRATARGKLKASIEPITIEQIETIVHDIGRAGAATLKVVLNK